LRTWATQFYPDGGAVGADPDRPSSGALVKAPTP
jgi:hypothetical protein